MHKNLLKKNLSKNMKIENLENKSNHEKESEIYPLKWMYPEASQTS